MSLTLVSTAPDPAAARVLEALLASRGLAVCVPCPPVGAGAVGVFVPRDQADRAREILRGDGHPELLEPSDAAPRPVPAVPLVPPPVLDVQDEDLAPREDTRTPSLPFPEPRAVPHDTPVPESERPVVLHRAAGEEGALLLAAVLRHRGIPAWAPVETDTRLRPTVVVLEGHRDEARACLDALFARLG